MEFWDVCDRNGVPTGEKREKNSFYGPDEYHPAVELWILNSKNQLLIQKRSGSCQLYPDIWSITAGRVQAGETPVEGCIREGYEELGVKFSREELIHFGHINRDDGSHMIWDAYLARLDWKEEEFILDPAEVAEVKWKTEEEMEHLIDAEQIFVYPEIRDFLHLIRDRYMTEK